MSRSFWQWVYLGQCIAAVVTGPLERKTGIRFLAWIPVSFYALGCFRNLR
jgi:hypothetical protein